MQLAVKNVQAIMMPYEYTSNMSLEDAKTQANAMGVEYHEISIHQMVDSFNTQLSNIFSGSQADTTERKPAGSYSWHPTNGNL